MASPTAMKAASEAEDSSLEAHPAVVSHLETLFLVETPSLLAVVSPPVADPSLPVADPSLPVAARSLPEVAASSPADHPSADHPSVDHPSADLPSVDLSVGVITALM